MFRSHDQMGHQGIDKVQQRILHRFDWPELRKACKRWVNACLSCLQVKVPRKMKFFLKPVESSEFNEVVQIDHQTICMTDSGYNQILVIIDHFTKLAEAAPCQTAWVEETCDHSITHWKSRDGCPMNFKCDNGKAFAGKALMRQRRKYDEKIFQAKPYAVGQYVWVFQNVISPEGTKNLLKHGEGRS